MFLPVSAILFLQSLGKLWRPWTTFLLPIIRAGFFCCHILLDRRVNIEVPSTRKEYSLLLCILQNKWGVRGREHCSAIEKALSIFPLYAFLSYRISEPLALNLFSAFFYPVVPPLASIKLFLIFTKILLQLFLVCVQPQDARFFILRQKICMFLHFCMF